MLSPSIDPRSAVALWFVAMCKAGQEHEAKVQLRRQRFGVYLPLMQTQRRYRGAWCERVEPLFPRYLFVQFNPFKQSAGKVKATRGVVALLSFGGNLATVPDQVIASMVKREDPVSGLYEDRSAALRKGDEVELLEGPFTGFRAILRESAGRRVTLLLEALGKVHRLTVSRHEVARVAA